MVYLGPSRGCRLANVEGRRFVCLVPLIQNFPEVNFVMSGVMLTFTLRSVTKLVLCVKRVVFEFACRSLSLQRNSSGALPSML